MRTPILLLFLTLMLLAPGCSTPSSPGEIPLTPTTEPRYGAGELLKGDLVVAGFGGPNNTHAGAAIVVLEYRSQPGEYVYTLVRPTDRGWAYISPADDWTMHLTRERMVFEGYRLDKSGYVDVGKIQPAATPTTGGSP